MLLLLMTPVLGRCLVTWLATAPARAGSPLGALLLAAVSPAAGATPAPHPLSPAVLGPIVVAGIAALGTVLVAWLNTRQKRAAAAPPEPAAPVVDDLALTTDGRLLILETNVAALRHEQSAGMTAVVDSLDRLARRLEEHIDRGTGRIPAQRGPTD